jgi:hypothetical protein
VNIKIFEGAVARNYMYQRLNIELSDGAIARNATD